MREKDILQASLQHLIQNTGVAVKETLVKPIPKLKRNPDSAVQLSMNGKVYNFLVEIKNELREIHLPKIIDSLTTPPEKWLLVSQYISKPNRALLKERGINHLDASGNCYIRQGSLFLYINDAPVTAQRQVATGKLWKATGLKLVFALLQNPGLVYGTYREVANAAGIALGTMGPLLQELEKEGYIGKTQGGARLEHRERLLERWSENFSTNLRPKLLQGRFRFVLAKDKANWRKLKAPHLWWGGEPAGGLLTGYLHPEKFTLYSEMPKTEVLKQLRLMPDVNGEVELLTVFWNTSTTISDHAFCAPTMLVYAELNASLDSRNRETAQRIKEKYHV